MKKLLVILISTLLCVSAVGAYTVQPGDTLSKIATIYGYTWQELAGLNPQIEDPNLIYPGENINTNGSALGATIPTVVALFETSLQNTISSSATTMTLVSGTMKNGNTLNGYYNFIIDEGNSNEEFVLATCVNTACSGMLRGIDPVDGKTEVAALKFSHRKGASVKITNYPELAILARIMNGDETLPNTISYSSSTSLGLMGSNVLTTKYYVDNVGAGGFTAGNIGDGKTIRANGTSPEKIDINTSTPDLSFIIEEGKFEVNTSTNSKIDAFWKNSWNATTTKPGNLTIENDLTVDSLITTGNSYSQFIPYYGDGSDGNLTVTSANFFPNSASSTVASAVATSTTSITVADASQFATSTYIFIHAVRGENAGRWEIKKVTDRNVDTDVVTLDTATINSYKTTSGANITQVLKVPQYNKVVFSTSGGIDTKAAWRAGDQTLGGVVVFYAKEGVIIKSGVTLTMSGFGYRGCDSATAGQNLAGEGTTNNCIAQYTPNGTGGGGANGSSNVGQGGYDFITAVDSIFNKSVSIFLGGGGGHGNNGNGDGTGQGGDGGGVFMPITPSFINFGTLNLAGVVGNTPTVGNIGGGGGGAGGALVAICEQYYEGTVTLTGGAGGVHSGTGGKGGAGGGNLATGTDGGANDGGAGAAGYKVYGWIANLLPKN